MNEAINPLVNPAVGTIQKPSARLEKEWKDGLYQSEKPHQTPGEWITPIS